MSRADDVLLEVAWFDRVKTDGPAIGEAEMMAWSVFVGVLTSKIAGRRIGDKDGLNFVPASFKRETDGRVRRIKRNVVARTAIVLDVEPSKRTGEVPPSLESIQDHIVF